MGRADRGRQDWKLKTGNRKREIESSIGHTWSTTGTTEATEGAVGVGVVSAERATATKAAAAAERRHDGNSLRARRLVMRRSRRTRGRFPDKVEVDKT